MKFINLPKTLLLLFLFVFNFFALTQAVQAQSGNLENVSDIINTNGYGEYANHSISFNLPWNALPIRTSDWILISMTNFSNITPPNSITGSIAGGNPQFSVFGKMARITNVAISSGSLVTIGGIAANNPSFDAGFQVAIIIAEDEAGTLIKNIATVTSTTNQGNVAITASIDTPQSRLVISGEGSPQSFITFTEDGAVIGTEVSAFNGYFGHVFSGIEPGDHQITFYAVDKYNLSTSPITLSIYTPTFQETTVSNQLLSPTISIDKTQYMLGDPIIATGTATPDSTITIFTEAPLRAYTTTTTNSGDWTYTISDTNTYMLGDYHIHALAQTTEGVTSLNSPSIGFRMSSSTSSSGEACGNITKGDLNCDSKIDLTDFSILMFYWGTNNASSDMNSDSLVDLTDFSIMMYWWGT